MKDKILKALLDNISVGTDYAGGMDYPILMLNDSSLSSGEYYTHETIKERLSWLADEIIKEIESQSPTERKEDEK